MALIRPTRFAALLIMIGMVAMGLSIWVWNWSRPDRPSDIVALRFFAAEPSLPSSTTQTYISRILVGAGLHFSPTFISAPQSVHALMSVDLTTREALELALSLPARPVPPVSPLTEPIPLPLPRPAQRPGRFIPDDHVFNDAQVVSFEERLKLTREQQPLWEAVELELRALSWRRPSGGGRPTLDINALQRLKTVFEKLTQALRDDQKREVRQLMGIVGL